MGALEAKMPQPRRRITLLYHSGQRAWQKVTKKGWSMVLPPRWGRKGDNK